MPEHKYTAGPWRVFTPEDYEGPSSLPGLGIENHEGKAVVWYAAEPETGLANDHDAHLIAAAPDLLQALIEVTASLEWYAHARCRGINDGPIMPSAMAVELARAAIAKALGQA